MSRFIAGDSRTTIECLDGSIEYEESGRGPTVVLVPGSFSTGAAWRHVIARWEDRFRSVTTSLLGYGGTTERRTAEDTDISHEAKIVESVLGWADAPAHLVGHSFGGLVALAVALRKQVRLRSLTVLEVPALELLRSAGEHGHYRAFREMTDSYFRAYRAGEKEAIWSMVDFYGGAGTFAAWPERVRTYAVSTTPINLRDWATGYGFELTREDLAGVDVPTLVIWGKVSHPAMQRANQLIGRSLPNASVATIAGAAHFMIATHPEEVAREIAGHVAAVEYGQPIDDGGAAAAARMPAND